MLRNLAGVNVFADGRARTLRPSRNGRNTPGIHAAAETLCRCLGDAPAARVTTSRDILDTGSWVRSWHHLRAGDRRKRKRRKVRFMVASVTAGRAGGSSISAQSAPGWCPSVWVVFIDTPAHASAAAPASLRCRITRTETFGVVSVLSSSQQDPHPHQSYLRSAQG